MATIRASGSLMVAFRGLGLLPVDLRAAVEVDALRDPPRGLLRQAYAVGVSVVCRLRGPADLRDAGQARERHVLDVVAGADRLRPQRRLDARDLLLADPGHQRRRIPVV